MQYIVYVSDRSERQSDKFDKSYSYVTLDYELESLANDLALKDKSITGAMVLINNGDYDEIWVTYSNAPYYVHTVYNKVIRYYRNEPYGNLPDVDNLPHGSGIDGNWTKDSPYVYCNSYHVMDSLGSYCGWLDFTVEFNKQITECTISFPNDKRYEIEEYDEYLEEGYFDDKLPDVSEYLEQTFDMFLVDWNKSQ